MVTIPKLLHGVNAVTAAVLISYAIASIAAESSCIPAQPQREPADGEWKGTLRLSYQMTYQGLPPIKMKLTGDLHFTLESEQETAEFVGPPLQRFCGRVPLGGKPIPGCDKHGNPVDAPSGPQVVTVKRRGRTHVLGRAFLAVRTDFDAVSPSVTFKYSAPTEKPAELRPKAEWGGEAGGDQIVAVSLMGSPSQFNYLTSAFAESRGRNDGRVTETGKASGTGAASSDFVTPEGPGHWEHQGSQQGGDERQMARLNLLIRDCWLMKGTLDENKIRQSVEGTGMRVEFLESSWEATLQERDLGYEHEVERFVGEPVPAKVTWEYVNRATAEYKRLVGEKPSEYRLCVAGPLVPKMNQIAERAIQNLIEDYPRVKDGATAPALCAANARIIELLRELELDGITRDECPLVNGVWQVMLDEQQALLATHPRGSAATCSPVTD